MSSPGLAVSAWAGIAFNRIIFLQTAFTTRDYLVQELWVQKSRLEGVIRVATNPGIKLTESRLPYHFSHLPSDARACSQLVDMLAFSCLGFTVRIQRPMQRLKLFVELEGFVRMITWGNLRSERDLFSFSLHQINTPLTWMQGRQSLTMVRILTLQEGHLLYICCDLRLFCVPVQPPYASLCCLLSRSQRWYPTTHPPQARAFKLWRGKTSTNMEWNKICVKSQDLDFVVQIFLFRGKKGSKTTSPTQRHVPLRDGDSLGSKQQTSHPSFQVPK